MTTYNKHNPQLANPIINKLLNILGNKWEDVSWGDDCVASISRNIPNNDALKKYYAENGIDESLYDDIMQIYIPNSTEYNFSQEEFNNYSVNFGYDTEVKNFETLEETIKAVKAFDNFSISPLVFGSTATEITGSGINNVSKTIGSSVVHKVSPVVVFFRPNTAPKSPALNSSTSSLSSAFRITNLEILSLASLVEFIT